MKVCRVCGQDKPLTEFYKNRANYEATRSRYYERNPEKLSAKLKLRAAVRYGRLMKPLACEKCGTETERSALHGHHSDYAKALDVVWVCAGCHAAEHHEIRQCA